MTAREPRSYANLVRWVREHADKSRARYGDPPITDEELANRLLSMKFLEPAEWFIGTLYNRENDPA